MRIPTDTRSRHRLTLGVFIVTTLLVVLLVEGIVSYQQFRYMDVQDRMELQTEITLLGELCKDALIRSDYAVVEDLVRRWLRDHEYLVRITATTPNGFVLVDAGRVSEGESRMVLSHVVEFGGRPLLSFRAVADFSSEETHILELQFNAMLVMAVVILLMGGVLWRVLQRIAILPLEHEVRERELKEQELLRRTAELEHVIGELESFSYAVSHDLRGPLRAIDGYGFALADEYAHVLDQPAMDYIERVRSAARRMSLVIDGLQNLSRISRHRLAVTEVDLSGLVSSEVTRLREDEPDRRVEVEIAPDVVVRGDSTLLDIALDNLLRNAWKYTSKREHAHIEFGVALQDGERVYFVRDNGAGFDMQYAGKLFGAFQRMHDPGEFPGSGIGLAIVSRVIRLHGGRIWAEAEPDKGACFYFTLDLDGTAQRGVQSGKP